MAFDCLVAKYICKKVFKEWWAHTTDCLWVMHPTFKSCFFSKEDNWPSLAGPTKSPYRTDMVVFSPEQGHTKTVGAYPPS
jgi:hypothetical protein